MANASTPNKLAVKTGSDLRNSERKKVLYSSKIAFDGGAYVLDCTISDISDTGARITLRKSCVLPANIYLIDLPNRVAFEADVVAQRNDGYGLKFLSTHPLAKITKPELQFLKRIWMQSI